MNTFAKVTESDVNRYCRKLAFDIIADAPNMPACIIAPVRGGLIPGVYMSHLLKIPLFPINYSLRDFKADLEIPTSFYHYMLNHTSKNVLLIDDIVDTGETFAGILEAFDHFDGVNLITAALLYNTSQAVAIDYSGEEFSRELNSDWFEFFWEK